MNNIISVFFINKLPNLIYNGAHNIFNNILIALTINKSFFANRLTKENYIKLLVLIFIGLIASIFIRLDFNFFHFFFLIKKYLNIKAVYLY